ncbi:hypothetical protein BZM27_37680, partial [Paraburkholderia steynii]
RVRAGGSSVVNSGGTASGTVVSSGGSARVGRDDGRYIGRQRRSADRDGRWQDKRYDSGSGGSQTSVRAAVTTARRSRRRMQTVGSGGVTSGTWWLRAARRTCSRRHRERLDRRERRHEISSGASVSGTQVLSGGTQHLFGSLTNPVVSAGGTLTIGQGTAAGELVGNTVNDGLLVFNRPDAITYIGNVTGAGRIEQQGTGTVVLNGDSHLFTGATTEVMTGTLAVAISTILARNWAATSSSMRRAPCAGMVRSRAA